MGEKPRFLGQTVRLLAGSGGPGTPRMGSAQHPR